MENLNRLIDHTLLKPDAKREEIENLCREAVEYSFFSVCINPYNIPFAVPILVDTDVKICTVIGFPLGADMPGMKAIEAKDALMLGADELDMVINIGALKDRQYDSVKQDIMSVVHLAKATGMKAVLDDSSADSKVTKVILETAELTDDEIRIACEIAMDAGADFVKTSTGFSPKGGATVHAVSLMKEVVGDRAGIKASGGIRDRETAVAMIDAGATRIGSSNSVNIIE